MYRQSPFAVRLGASGVLSLAVALSWATAACGSSKGGGAGGTVTDAGGDGLADTTVQPVGASVWGVVYAPGAVPLAGVNVHLGTTAATSDAGGKFTLDMGTVATAVVVFEKTGYAPAYRQVASKGGHLVTVSAVMTPTTTSGTVNGASGGVVQITTGVTLNFPANALATADGEPAQGTVDVVTTWLPPDQAIDNAPFLLQAMDGTDLTPLITYGMIEISANAQGQPLQIVSGKTVQLKLPALDVDPDSAGLFFGNPTTGSWELQGAAAKVGGQWVAELPHLSWWNVDGFYKVPNDKKACVTFRARLNNGNPVAGVEVKSAWGPSNNYTIAGGTDPNGLLCNDSFPGGTTLTINWKAALNTGATEVLSGSFSVTPSAYGAKCGASDCERVDIPIQCFKDAHCGSGQSCVAGLCTGGDTDAINGGDSTSSDVPEDKPCTPVCQPNQCSDDGCGKPCMSCPSGQACNGNTQLCETCTADCSGQTCGSDGCNGSCGTCQAGLSCNGQNCVGACTFCPGGKDCNTFGFEDGDKGWDMKGDVTVVEQMGPAMPAEGKKMLRLSTGLAYAAPSWAQKALCASKGVKNLTFQWRMYSEEFEEYCGSTYQDYFVVSVLQADGTKLELARWTIDDVCPQGVNNCTKCGSKSPGITKTDLKFDHGDVWGTTWQTTTVALPANSESATLVWEVNDVGDSSYDTVVLLDGIVLSL